MPQTSILSLYFLDLQPGTLLQRQFSLQRSRSLLLYLSQLAPNLSLYNTRNHSLHAALNSSFFLSHQSKNMWLQKRTKSIWKFHTIHHGLVQNSLDFLRNNHLLLTHTEQLHQYPTTIQQRLFRWIHDSYRTRFSISLQFSKSPRLEISFLLSRIQTFLRRHEFERY